MAEGQFIVRPGYWYTPSPWREDLARTQVHYILLEKEQEGSLYTWEPQKTACGIPLLDLWDHPALGGRVTCRRCLRTKYHRRLVEPSEQLAMN
jgi:hypothetical protein